MAVYEFDERLPNEDVLSYLARHNALPGPAAREATEEEVAAVDRTEEFLAGAFILIPDSPEEGTVTNE
jgi:hypothetical protein